MQGQRFVEFDLVRTEYVRQWLQCDQTKKRLLGSEEAVFQCKACLHPPVVTGEHLAARTKHGPEYGANDIYLCSLRVKYLSEACQCSQACLSRYPRNRWANDRLNLNCFDHHKIYLRAKQNSSVVFLRCGARCSPEHVNNQRAPSRHMWTASETSVWRRKVADEVARSIICSLWPCVMPPTRLVILGTVRLEGLCNRIQSTAALYRLDIWMSVEPLQTSLALRSRLALTSVHLWKRCKPRVFRTLVLMT